MKVIVNKMYDMWCRLTDDLLEAKSDEMLETNNADIIDFREEGKKAWKMIMECSQKSKLSPKASAAFWAAWGNCKVTYKEIADMLNKEPEKWNWKWKQRAVTEEQVKWLIDKARKKIDYDTKKEIYLLKLKLQDEQRP
jgi:hypothetical protein